MLELLLATSLTVVTGLKPEPPTPMQVHGHNRVRVIVDLARSCHRLVAAHDVVAERGADEKTLLELSERAAMNNARLSVMLVQPFSYLPLPRLY